MKKVFVSLGIILVIAGIVIVGVYGGAKGFTDWNDFRLHDITKADDAFEYSLESMQDLEKIEIEANQFCVYVIKTEKADKVSIKFMSNLPNDVNISVVQDGSTIKVAQTADAQRFVQRIWNGEYLKFFVVIELPNTEAFNNVTIEGKVTHGVLFVAGQIR